MIKHCEIIITNEGDMSISAVIGVEDFYLMVLCLPCLKCWLCLEKILGVTGGCELVLKKVSLNFKNY